MMHAQQCDSAICVWFVILKLISDTGLCDSHVHLSSGPILIVNMQTAILALLQARTLGVTQSIMRARQRSDCEQVSSLLSRVWLTKVKILPKVNFCLLLAEQMSFGAKS
jgi:hypothetical protein